MSLPTACGDGMIVRSLRLVDHVWVPVGAACGMHVPAEAATSLEGGFLASTSGGETGNLYSLGMRWGAIEPSVSTAELGLTAFAGPGTSSWFGAIVDLDVARAISSSRE